MKMFSYSSHLREHPFIENIIDRRNTFHKKHLKSILLVGNVIEILKCWNKNTFSLKIAWKVGRAVAFWYYNNAINKQETRLDVENETEIPDLIKKLSFIESMTDHWSLINDRTIHETSK